MGAASHCSVNKFCSECFALTGYFCFCELHDGQLCALCGSLVQTMYARACICLAFAVPLVVSCTVDNSVRCAVCWFRLCARAPACLWLLLSLWLCSRANPWVGVSPCHAPCAHVLRQQPV